jgi:methyltransferase family protein
MMVGDTSRSHEIIGELKISYCSDPDRERAGKGLELFPLINRALGTNKLQNWMMSCSEKVALIFLLEHLRPKVAIEIGTRDGGSLQVLARFCDRVYSIDTDPDVPRRLEGKFSNVEYLVGRSAQILPPLLDRLQRDGAELGFALVDGDHSAEGVREDLDNLLRFRPIVPFYVVMHDSFNPQCRIGLTRANWSANRYVHAVELDFVAGIVHYAPAYRDELWGGLALGILLPFEREGRFEITGSAEQTYKAITVSRYLLLKRLTAEGKRTLRRAAGRTKRVLLGG